MSNTNKKFSLNKYLVWTMKRFGKERSKQEWERILRLRKANCHPWPDQCNGKNVVNDRIRGYDIIEQWCIVD